MFVPEFLYRLSQRDEQVTWLDPRLFDEVAAVAAASVTVQDVVPEGRVLLLQSACATQTPGAGQNITRLTLQVVGQVANAPAVLLATDSTIGAANDQSDINWSGSIIVPPGWTVRGSGAFSAGVAVNNVRLSYAGVLIPVANVQRV